MPSARLIIDRPRPGAENMARDEALLRSQPDPVSPVTLRFYAWDPPTISLGYFQSISEYQRLPPPAGRLAVVRRTTGGGAILHDLEVTYSIAIPVDHPLVAGDPNRLYRLAHQAIIAAVGPAAVFCDAVMGPRTGPAAASCCGGVQQGPFFCFSRRHPLDVVTEDARAPDGYAKLAGSAQRRTKSMILQHGSLMIENRFPQQQTACWGRLGGATEFAGATQQLLPQFERQLGMSLVSSDFRPEESALVPAHCERYSGDAWTHHRRVILPSTMSSE